MAAFQETQALKIVENLTTEHHEILVRQLHALKERVQKAPRQLFVQFMLTSRLMMQTVQSATLHYSMKKPAELSSFRWTVDGKDTARTHIEELWERLIPMALSTQSLDLVDVGDYTYFNRFMSKLPEPPYHIRKLGLQTEGDFEGPDTRMIFGEYFTYGQSKDNLGLQLVDIVASAFQRAMNGKLQPSGWSRLGRLFVQHEGNAAKYTVLQSEETELVLTSDVLEARKRHSLVIQQINALARPIV